MPLPRELALIINDIFNQNGHLPEWEVFGNSNGDMRIVLTWRKVDNSKEIKRRSLGKWKLRQSSVSYDEPGELLEDEKNMSLQNKQGENRNNTKKSLDVDETRKDTEKKNVDEDETRKDTEKKSVDEDETRKDTANESDIEDVAKKKNMEKSVHENEAKTDEDGEKLKGSREDKGTGKTGERATGNDSKEHKQRKKNPFRKLKKNEKIERPKGKLQLSLSINEKSNGEDNNRNNDLEAGWENCIDCKYNGFCDDVIHKGEYLTILLADAEYGNESEGCSCYVCTSGAVHNGCVYREVLRLKHDYKLFDKRNLCFCKVCMPFKYRNMCLRQELRLLRKEGIDIYYRLTYDGEDGNEGYHPELRNNDSLDVNYHSDDEMEETIQALCLDDVVLEITNEDKINFRNCMDCQFNGFCDDVGHKKLYMKLLQLDDEDFEKLEEHCSCLVCEFKGAAHSGCPKREIKRLRYDLKLFDIRNLCDCRQCVPFKYRTICLRQELKQLRRKGNINLYQKLC